MNRGLRLVVGGLVFLLLVGGVGWWWRGRGTVVVEVSEVKRQEVVRSVIAPGELKAENETSIYAPLTGKIEEVYVGDQDEVKKEQKLFRYELVSLLTAVEKSKSAVESAKTNLENLRRSFPTDKELAAAKSLVNQTKAVWEDAKKAYQDDKNKKTRAARDRARTTYKQALAQKETLEKRAPTQQSIENAKQAVKAAEQALLETRVNLGKATVTAPRGGKISFNELVQASQATAMAGSTEFKLEPGVVVQIGQKLANIRPLKNSLIFEAEVAEIEINKIKTGQQAVVTLDAYPETKLNGKVKTIVPETHLNNTGEKVLRVEIKLKKFPKGPRPRFGLSGDVAITVSREKNKLVVPFEAVSFRKDQAMVFVLEGQTLKELEVSLGEEVDGVYEVLQGLSPGQKVVVSDQQNLKNGQQVMVKNADNSDSSNN